MSKNINPRKKAINVCIDFRSSEDNKTIGQQLEDRHIAETQTPFVSEYVGLKNPVKLNISPETFKKIGVNNG